MASLHELGTVRIPGTGRPPLPAFAFRMRAAPRRFAVRASRVPSCAPGADFRDDRLQVPDIDGNDFDLATLAGKVVCVVNVACE